MSDFFFTKSPTQSYIIATCYEYISIEQYYVLNEIFYKGLFKENLNQQQKDYNQAMRRVCTAVEWVFGYIVN